MAGLVPAISLKRALRLPDRDRRDKPGDDTFVVARRLVPYEQPVVEPQVSHFMQVPLRTSVKLPHSPQASPS